MLETLWLETLRAGLHNLNSSYGVPILPVPLRASSSDIRLREHRLALLPSRRDAPENSARGVFRTPAKRAYAGLQCRLTERTRFPPASFAT